MAELGDIPFRLTPINIWPDRLRRSRATSQFKASWSSTMDLLNRELRMLGAKNVTMQMALTEGEIRLDGRPRANARPQHPGVILACDSKHGPLTWTVDTYDHWQDNIRAIALALQALRAVDRYGVTDKGQQYRGFKELPKPADAPPTFHTKLDAREFLREKAGGLTGVRSDDELIRAAEKATHPDTGGVTASAKDFADVEWAKEVLRSDGVPDA